MARALSPALLPSCSPSLLRRCPASQTVMAGGEALPAELAARASTRRPPAELHNRYGPTETAI